MDVESHARDCQNQPVAMDISETEEEVAVVSGSCANGN